VDHQTEQQLISNLLKLKPRPTMVIISHRISALTHCDHILVLESGKIIMQGTHADLIKKKGIYQDTWEYQRTANQQ